MKRMFDWKYAIAIFVALAGVGVPVLLWQADQSRSLKLNVISKTAISPVSVAALSGLKLTLDGIEVSDARLTVMELVNNGNRPIVPGDFESPVEISLKSLGKIVRINLGDVSPVELKPSFSLKDGKILLQPFLMNPGDRARVSIITSGGEPQFTVRGRIAGIKGIELNAQALTKSSKKIWFELTISFLLFGIYFGVGFDFFHSWRERRTDRRLLALMIVSVSGGALFTIELAKNYGYPYWQLYGMQIIVGLIFGLLSNFLRPKKVSLTAKNS